MPLTPNDIHALILGACEYVTLHGERDFVDVIKVKDLEVGRLSGGPNAIT